MRADDDAGFTLIEVLVVTAIVVLACGTAGTFFLGGTTPAVATAARDVAAAIAEGRRTAVAFDTATVAFLPATAGSGYRARVYRGLPGDPVFRAQNGPSYDSTVTIGETAAPLGAPGFAFGIARDGAIAGYANLTANAAQATRIACPAGGSFSVHLAYVRDARDIAVPCALAQTGAAVLAVTTPAPAATAAASAGTGCPAGRTCALPALPGAPAAACPPGTITDANVAGLCDAAIAVTPPPVVVPSTAAPAATPTPCPAGYSGTAPACVGQMIEQYSAAADSYSVHSALLFANGSICDDGGCSVTGPIDWSWGCGFAARGGSTATGGSNAVHFTADNPYTSSVGSMIAAAFHDAAAGGNGSGVVATEDTFCNGLPAPDP